MIAVEIDQSAGAGARRYRPEAAYLRWILELETPAAIDAIRDVFEFASDDCDLEITDLSPPVSEPAGPEEPAQEVPVETVEQPVEIAAELPVEPTAAPVAEDEPPAAEAAPQTPAKNAPLPRKKAPRPRRRR